MKKSILFLLLVSFAFANVTKLDKSKFPEHFLESFNIYKKARMTKDAQKLYDLQVPFFKYLNPFSKFETFVGWLTETESIKIGKILKKNDDFVEILLKLKLKNKKNMLYYNQSWYRIGKRYYVLTDENLIFKY